MGTLWYFWTCTLEGVGLFPIGHRLIFDWLVKYSNWKPLIAQLGNYFRCGRSKKGRWLGWVPGQTHPGGWSCHRWGWGSWEAWSIPQLFGIWHAGSAGTGPTQVTTTNFLHPSSKSAASAFPSPPAPAAYWTFRLRLELILIIHCEPNMDNVYNATTGLQVVWAKSAL